MSAKKTETVLINLEPETFKMLEKIRIEEDRPRGYVARELMIRGIGLYMKDGYLKDNSSVANIVHNALQKAIPAGTLRQKKAPVVAHPAGKRQVQRMIDDADIAEIQSRLKPRKRKAR